MEYDAQKRIKEEKFFNETGSPCLINEGYARIRKKYYQNGNIKSIEYLDEKECCTMNRELGYAYIGYSYADEN